MKNWKVRKVIAAPELIPEEHRLKRSLSWPHLVALGVGAIVGTGILTLIGVGAGKAGPAVILSFAMAGVICACAGLLMAGTRESATLNAVLVLIKMAALALFIAVALPVFKASHFHPFMPFGFPKSGPAGSEVGVMAGAAIIFFAFYGFDAIATAA